MWATIGPKWSLAQICIKSPPVLSYVRRTGGLVCILPNSPADLRTFMYFLTLSFLLAVGRPLPVVFNPAPTAEEVLELHRTYCDALTDLFEQHKGAAGLPKDAHLEIM